MKNDLKIKGVFFEHCIYAINIDCKDIDKRFSILIDNYTTIDSPMFNITDNRIIINIKYTYVYFSNIKASIYGGSFPYICTYLMNTTNITDSIFTSSGEYVKDRYMLDFYGTNNGNGQSIASIANSIFNSLYDNIRFHTYIAYLENSTFEGSIDRFIYLELSSQLVLINSTNCFMKRSVNKSIGIGRQSNIYFNDLNNLINFSEFSQWNNKCYNLLIITPSFTISDLFKQTRVFSFLLRSSKSSIYSESFTFKYSCLFSNSIILSQKIFTFLPMVLKLI